jgi:predicted NBD/HSP70 family sugar kinase
VVQRVAGTPGVLRAINDRVALELLLRHGSLSRTQLVELTGVSKPTAAELLSRLVADGLVVHRGTTTGARGPNAQLYGVNRDLGHVVGVNAEEDRVTAAVADITGRVVGEASLAVDLTGGENPVAHVRRAVRAAARNAKVSLKALRQVVVGITGSYDPHTESVIYASHLPGWEAPGVVKELRSAFGMPLVIENDANLAAVGERTRGSAREVDTFALLWVARGLGLAVELGGRLYQGATGGAGEVGYILVGGRSVTFQDSVGSGAILQLARRHGLVGASAEAVVAAAVAGGESKLPFLHELAERLATGIATIVAVLDPPMIVLAGSTCHAGGSLLVELTSAELSRISPFRTPLVASAVSGSPVLAGAVDTAVALGRSQVFGASAADPWRPTAPALSTKA